MGWDIYCVACGCPFYTNKVIKNTHLLSKYLNFNEKNKYYGIKPDGLWEDSEHLLESLKKKITPIDYVTLVKSLTISKSHKWLNKSVIITPNGVFTNVSKHGTDWITDKYGNEYDHGADGYNKATFHLMHLDCYKLFTHKYGKIHFDNIGIKKYSPVLKTIDYGIVNKYQGQYFYTELAYLENPFVLESPLKNEKNKNRILQIKLIIGLDSSNKPSKKPSKKPSNKPSKKSSNKPSKKSPSKKSPSKKSPTNKPSKKNPRPSPSQSATLFKVGTKKKGNDGNIWQVKMNKNNINKWVKI